MTRTAKLGTEMAAGIQRAAKEMHGIVVSAGLMDKTVKVRTEGQRWEQKVQKWFRVPRLRLVHDPANSLRQGDVVAITSSWRHSQHVRHVVKHIIAPYGVGIDERPPIPPLEEYAHQLLEKRQAKDERRAFRLEARKYINTSIALTVYAKRSIERFRRAVGRPAAVAKVQKPELGNGGENNISGSG